MDFLSFPQGETFQIEGYQAMGTDTAIPKEFCPCW
jgi:hypothetical protein